MLNNQQLLSLVAAGQISEKRLDQSVRRLLKAKFEMGLFDDPYVDQKEAQNIVGNEQYMKLGAEAQRKSVVLLKNGKDQALLPLGSGLKIYVENIDPQIANQYGLVVDKPKAADVAILRVQAPYEERTDDFIEQFFHQGPLDFDMEEKERWMEIMDQVPTVFCVYMDRPAVMPELNQSAGGGIS